MENENKAIEGIIIGKGGRKIKELCERFGCRIKIE